MSDDGERLAGAPSITSFGFGARLNPQQQAAVEEGRRRRRDWRTKTMEGAFDTIRQLFDHARISLRILCYNMSANIADGKIDHAFRMAQALQVAAISSTSKVAIARRVAPFAEKYKIIWAGHNHGSTRFRRGRIP